MPLELIDRKARNSRPVICRCQGWAWRCRARCVGARPGRRATASMAKPAGCSLVSGAGGRSQISTLFGIGKEEECLRTLGYRHAGTQPARRRLAFRQRACRSVRGLAWPAARQLLLPALRQEAWAATSAFALPAGVDGARGSAASPNGVFLARDLINTPTNDMGPPELGAAAARTLAKTHKAQVSVDRRAMRCSSENFPMIHAVGRACGEAPRLHRPELGPRNGARRSRWSARACRFDTGGLDIKPSSGMLLMKKDMGGAANVLGLAHDDHGRRAEGAGCAC